MTSYLFVCITIYWLADVNIVIVIYLKSISDIYNVGYNMSQQ